ncbi:thrombospondin-1-like isoform X2 [Mytilus trossulus]|uniref:thrombospondin-1-like isoform X2 n=1 Tax=Mytilus trossulus TaxID=6551 RepID=UPI003005B217
MHQQTLIYCMFLIVQTVNGDTWSQWTPWACSVTCGNGIKSRTRHCLSSFCFGEILFGQQREQSSCFTIACPVDGNWGPWGIFEPCSVTCGTGLHNRSRICNDPAPSLNGKPCNGEENSSEICNTEVCAVDGNWGPWSSFGPCSEACGKGVKKRSRVCNDPAPSQNGKPCDGEDTNSISCNGAECPAFTATLPGGVHPYQNGAIIGYPIKLLDNSGYSNGIFTVLPGMGGVYSVSVTIMSGSVIGHTTLRKNGAILVWLFTNKEYDMASQTINIQLAEGDRIWVQMTNQASSLFDVYNTFSAVRIV